MKSSDASRLDLSDSQSKSLQPQKDVINTTASVSRNIDQILDVVRHFTCSLFDWLNVQIVLDFHTIEGLWCLTVEHVFRAEVLPVVDIHNFL